jgi:RNA polymerase sigma-54 factor
MAQGLHLSQRMTLSQVLAPQLQQSLALLQAPVLELRAMVAQELQQNPVLEELATPELTAREKEEGEVEAEGENGEMTPVDPAEPPRDLTFDPAEEKPRDASAEEFQADWERLVQMDQDWRDSFGQTSMPLRQREEEEEKRQFLFDSLVASTSLQETLVEQMRLSELSEEQRQIAQLVIGNIDDHGYLQSSLAELAGLTSISQDQIEAVLKVVQTFHPPGVGARDLRECLLLQLERRGQQETLDYRIVQHCMEALGKRRIPEIARKLGATLDEVQDAFRRIGSLDPRPGRAYSPDGNQYIVPEVYVQDVDGEFVVSTSNDHIPHLRISNLYKDLMSQPDSSGEVRDYIREKIRAGKFLIKSLHQRQQTILNIAKEIVNRQRDFMEKGVAHLKPLTMVQVAEVVGVHETTVSRAVSGKYMETPQGTYEMKFFFTSGIQTASGTDVSNTSVKDMLNDMIKKEDSTQPLSDEEIVKLLSDKGIKIARRTVAKYRSELNILPSHLRRVY